MRDSVRQFLSEIKIKVQRVLPCGTKAEDALRFVGVTGCGWEPVSCG